jgi:hypothetical protein
MFSPWKQLTARPAALRKQPASVSIEDEVGDETLHVVTANEVAQRFLADNPHPPRSGVHALIRAGAANLLLPDELLRVEAEICRRGLPSPLCPTLRQELTPRELLEFIHWQAVTPAAPAAFAEADSVRGLIESFRWERGALEPLGSPSVMAIACCSANYSKSSKRCDAGEAVV